MTRGARIGLIVITCIVGMIVLGSIIDHFQSSLRSPEQQQIINERMQFANSSEICKSLGHFGGCHYNAEYDPNTLTVFIDRVKPQFYRRVASEMLETNDLVPALKRARYSAKVAVPSGPYCSENLSSVPVLSLLQDALERDATMLA